MQIFGKKTELETLTRRRDRLTAKTQAARTELQRATDEQIKLLTESDDDNPKAETAALRRVELATSTLKALEAALAKIEEEISDAQHRADQEREALERDAAADAIERQVLALEKTVEPTLTALRAFSKAAGELEHVSYEINAIARYAHGAGSELEVAAALSIAEMRAKVTAVRAGQSRIPQRAPAPSPPPPAPALEKIWVVKPISFTQDGQIRRVDLNQQVDLLPALAKKAISVAAAVAIGHERFGKRVSSSRRDQGFGPSLADCIQLDDVAEAEAREQPQPEQFRVLHSRVDPNLEIVDRGPSYTLKTNGADVAA
jgi:hypothetical protein